MTTSDQRSIFLVRFRIVGKSAVLDFWFKKCIIRGIQVKTLKPSMDNGKRGVGDCDKNFSLSNTKTKEDHFVS
jgi:hypothetical protein